MEINVKYNGTSVHIAGLHTRNKDTEFAYSLTSCPALTRGRFCTAKGEYATGAEALAAAELKGKVMGKKVCRHCATAAAHPINN